MKANIIFNAFLATGWFIEPTSKLIDEIKGAAKAMLYEKFKTNEAVSTNIFARLYDLSHENGERGKGNSHYRFANDILRLNCLRWDVGDPHKNVLVTGDDEIRIAGFPFSNRIVMPGLIRDLKYLASPAGSDITAIIFLDEFLDDPFFQAEIGVFKTLGYDVFIYRENEGTLTEATEQGGNNDAQNKTVGVCIGGLSDAIADLITRKRKRGPADDNTDDSNRSD